MFALPQGILLLALAGGFVDHDGDGSFDKTLNVSGTVDLDVQTDSGGITIRQGSSGVVRIHAVLKAGNGFFNFGNAQDRIREIENHPPIEQDGSHIRVGYVHDHDLFRNISMRLEIETPATTQLRAHADSGGIRVDDIRGPVECKTDSGGIHIANIGAEVNAAADSGGIHVRNVKGSLVAHADSGGIEAAGIAGSIDAHTDSGSLSIAQTAAAGITAKADSGAIAITLAPGAGYDVTADTSSGHITVPHMTVHNTISSHHVEGRVGEGGPMVRAKADSGSVTIN